MAGVGRRSSRQRRPHHAPDAAGHGQGTSRPRHGQQPGQDDGRQHHAEDGPRRRPRPVQVGDRRQPDPGVRLDVGEVVGQVAVDLPGGEEEERPQRPPAERRHGDPAGKAADTDHHPGDDGLRPRHAPQQAVDDLQPHGDGEQEQAPRREQPGGDREDGAEEDDPGYAEGQADVAVGDRVTLEGGVDVEPGHVALAGPQRLRVRAIVQDVVERVHGELAGQRGHHAQQRDARAGEMAEGDAARRGLAERWRAAPGGRGTCRTSRPPGGSCAAPGRPVPARGRPPSATPSVYHSSSGAVPRAAVGLGQSRTPASPASSGACQSTSMVTLKVGGSLWTAGRPGAT